VVTSAKFIKIHSWNSHITILCYILGVIDPEIVIEVVLSPTLTPAKASVPPNPL